MFCWLLTIRHANPRLRWHGELLLFRIGYGKDFRQSRIGADVNFGLRLHQDDLARHHVSELLAWLTRLFS